MASDVYITPSPPPAPSTGLWGGCPSPSSLAHRILVHHTHQMHHRAQLQKPPPFDVDIVPVEPSTAALHAPHVRRSFLTCVQKTLPSFAIGRPPFTSLWTKLVEFFGDGAPDVPLCKHHLEGCSLNFGYVGFGDGWGRLKHLQSTFLCHAIPNFGSVGWGDCWMSLFLSRHLSNILLVWGDFGAYFGFPSLPKGYAFVGDLYI